MRSQSPERVYVAAPWDHRGTARHVRDELVQQGFVVTSRWLDLQHNGHVGDDVLTQEAANDIDDVFDADVVLVLNLKMSEGKAVETGLAIAWHIPVIVIGQRSATNIFHYCPGVQVVPTLDAAIQLMREAQ